MLKIYAFLTIFLVAMLSAQTVITTPGPHSIWTGDTLKKDSLKTASKIIYTSGFSSVLVRTKTTNPADSTNYRIYYKTGFALTDSFGIPCDSAGASISNTITRIVDDSSSTWDEKSITLPKAPYVKLYIKADGTKHGNRARIWTYLYLVK